MFVNKNNCTLVQLSELLLVSGIRAIFKIADDMNESYNLLALVLKQHYIDRQGVIISAREIIRNYINNNKPTYEETLSQLYKLMSDLQPDILLFFLTTVPFPAQMEENPSHLASLMKQMMSPMFHNKVRPVIIQYLKEHVPRLVPISFPNSSSEQNELIELPVAKDLQPDEPSSSGLEENGELIEPRANENVKSVIDVNIEQNKMESKKENKFKNKIKKPQKKTAVIKPLLNMCAENISKSHLFYKFFYNKKKETAWKLANDKKCTEANRLHYLAVIRDVNKKIEWLKMVETGKVPLKVMEEEYGKSDIFYLKALHQHANLNVNMEITPQLSQSIDTFLNKIDQPK